METDREPAASSGSALLSHPLITRRPFYARLHHQNLISSLQIPLGQTVLLSQSSDYPSDPAVDHGTCGYTSEVLQSEHKLGHLFIFCCGRHAGRRFRCVSGASLGRLLTPCPGGAVVRATIHRNRRPVDRLIRSAMTDFRPIARRSAIDRYRLIAVRLTPRVSRLRHPRGRPASRRGR